MRGGVRGRARRSGRAGRPARRRRVEGGLGGRLRRRELLIRRAAGGVIHQATLSLEHEFEVLRAAHEAGVKVPEPIAYLGEVEGREAFVMERIHGETIGRRIVKSPPRASTCSSPRSWRRSTRSRPSGCPSSRRATGSHASTRSSTRSASRTRRSSWACTGRRSACPPIASRSSSTATGGSEHRRRRAGNRGRARLGVRATSPTRSRISRGRSSGRGASAPTTATSAGSATSTATSRATPS